MIPFVLIVLLLIVEIALSLKKDLHYRNVDSVMAAIIVCFVQFVANVIVILFDNSSWIAWITHDSLFLLQAVAVIAVKCFSRKKDKYTKYGIPPKYTSGWRFEFIKRYYEFDDNAPKVQAKPITPYKGWVAFVCAIILGSTFYMQSNTYIASNNTLFLPYPALGLLSALIEFAIFCDCDTRWKPIIEKYKRRIGCSNRREFAKARYANIDKFEYLFVKNHMWEDHHISHATKINWKQNQKQKGITYYDFTDKSTKEYDKTEYNPALEAFIKTNNLETNDLYVAAYNLIDKDQNVLIKTPSYVDFEPYFTALVKMKVAKTQKTVLVVSSEERKATTIKKLENAFEEYFGFEGIPVIETIDECVKKARHREESANKESETKKKFSHFFELSKEDVKATELSFDVPVKEADVIIAAPEDICEPESAEIVRDIVKDIGLIVYYDFSDCVQEEALFARVVHSVLDFDDKVSTLYMSDGFFDLEQVIDNFFSKRNIYRIDVPRKPSPESYVTGWKAENINEMQARTFSDASRSIGNHIPVLYDGDSTVSNDFMIVEDEYDAYSENYSNIAQDPLSERLDCHVGWTDVLGGNSVFCAVSDTYNNAAHAYRAMCGIGTVNEYINIISRPYLLRNYLMYHLRYFAHMPGVLSSYSPGVIKTPRAIAYEACTKAHIVGCTEEQLYKYISETGLNTEKNPASMIKALAETVFGESLDDLSVTVGETNERYYINYSAYKKIVEKVGLVEKIHFVNNNKVILRNKREYPCVIPQQKIVLNGVKYTVEKVEGSRIEITDSNLREPIFVNRTVRTCNINAKKCETFATLVQHGSDSSIEFRRLVCDAEIATLGNIVFKDNYHPLSENCRFDYREVPEKPVSAYNDINVFSIKISSPLISRENSDKLAHLFAILMNEMMPTFFPKYSSRILIGCNGWIIDENLNKDSITTLNIAAQMNINGIEELNENEICLYILEDSALETGLVNVFWQDEEFRYMLKILEDYLYYQEMIRREEFENIFACDYKPLLYRLRRILLRVINETIDAPGGNSNPRYLNSIRRGRNKFNRIERHQLFNMTCDFCGKKIESKSGQQYKYHYYSYSGKISCMSCYSKAVCSEKYSQGDIALLQDYINEWFTKRYKSSVTHPFYNYLEDAEFLADTCGSHNEYIVTDDVDKGNLVGISLTDVDGMVGAVSNDEYIPVTPLNPPDEEGYISLEEVERAAYHVTDRGMSFVLIENGLPYKEYMGVLCHEMTHQWQSKNLDRGKLITNVPGAKVNEFGLAVPLDLYRIEGHAEWERIQYIKRHWSWLRAIKEIALLKARIDPYGCGYIWMSKMMRVGGDDKRIPVERTASFIMKRNWYQLTKNSFALMRLYFGNGETVTESPTTVTTPIPRTEAPPSPNPVNVSDKGTPYVPQAKDRAMHEDISYYYRNAITDSEKSLYDTLLAGILQHDEKATIEATDANMEKLERVIGCIRGDHPEIFWFDTFALLNCDVTFYYNATKTEAEDLKARMEPVIAKYLEEIDDSMSAYDVTLHFHMKIINSADYDTITLEKGEQEGIDYIRTICGVFLNNKAVCAGYARAMQYLLQKCGIECAYVRGNTLGNETSAGGAHAWNLVKIDGDYYYLDTTWDDSSNTNQEVKNTRMSFDYFCITTEELLRSRKLDLNVLEIPFLTAKKANYYYHNDLIIDSYDIEKLKIMAQNAAKTGRTAMTFKCSSQEVYDVAYNKLYANAEDCYVLLAEAHKKDATVKETSCIRFYNEKIRTITLLFERE